MAQALVNAFKAPVGVTGGLEEVVLVPGGGGCYEISVDGKLVYSKLQTGQHISDQDAVALVRKAAAG